MNVTKICIPHAIPHGSCSFTIPQVLPRDRTGYFEQNNKVVPLLHFPVIIPCLLSLNTHTRVCVDRDDRDDEAIFPESGCLQLQRQGSLVERSSYEGL